MAEDMKKAELIASERLNDKLLESEKKYLEEKKRLAEQEQGTQSAIRRREYIEKLATATNNLAIDRASRNERLRLLKEANDEYLAELKEAAEREREIYEQLKKDISDIYDDILDKADATILQTEKKRAKMEEKLSDYGNLTKRIIFRGTGEGGSDEIFYDLVDLTKTTDTLEKYAENLTKIKDRMQSGGIDQSYINSLVSMVSELSVDKGLIFTNELSAKDDKDFSEYINAWIAKEKTAKSISAQIYESEMQKSISDTLSYMKTELENMGLDVPEGFFLSGSVSAQRFGSGFVDELTRQMEEIQKVINSFNLSINLDAKINQKEDSGKTSIYSPTYQINSTGAVDATLSSIKALETRKVLSGIV